MKTKMNSNNADPQARDLSMLDFALARAAGFIVLLLMAALVSILVSALR